MRVRPWEEMALVFFEDADAGMVRRVDRGLVGMTQELLTLAELLQTLGGIFVCFYGFLIYVYEYIYI